ncbi:hypothetical protein GCM10009792_25820 [Microcella alkalica]|uniref:UDP-glucose 6-dehydrogenase n=1 Tax=Microcella alkalica TaxID=355930 RepID=A0A839EEJ0_9MICO|nr:UDP-glucose 6-dehydrogenase [Microcella alkalica]
MTVTPILPEIVELPDAGRRTLEVIRRIAGGEVAGLRIAAIGATARRRPECGQGRGCLSLAVMRALMREGATVTAFDPEADQDAVAAHPDISFVDSLARAILDDRIFAVLCQWRELRLADPYIVGLLVAARRVVDCRRALDAERYSAARGEYLALDD